MPRFGTANLESLSLLFFFFFVSHRFLFRSSETSFFPKNAYILHYLDFLILGIVRLSSALHPFAKI
ncbi:hypothetical protein F4678DRAFT_427866, partial [Xylaria arbuscula]